MSATGIYDLLCFMYAYTYEVKQNKPVYRSVWQTIQRHSLAAPIV